MRLPLGERSRGEIAAGEAAHAVDEDIDPAVGVEHTLDEGAEARLVGDVGRSEVERAGGRADALRSASGSAGTA